MAGNKYNSLHPSVETHRSRGCSVPDKTAHSSADKFCHQRNDRSRHRCCAEMTTWLDTQLFLLRHHYRKTEHPQLGHDSGRPGLMHGIGPEHSQPNRDISIKLICRSVCQLNFNSNSNNIFLIYFLHIRRHCSLKAKATSYVLVAVLCFFFFWRDCSAMAGQIFPKYSLKDVFVVLVINGSNGTYCPPPKKNWASKRPFLEQKIQTPSYLDCLCVETKRISGKTIV